MSLAKAIQAALEAVRQTAFPEVETICVDSTAGTKADCFIFISGQKEEHISTGENQTQTVNQAAIVFILQKIGSTDVHTVIDTVDATAEKIEAELKKNPRLVSTTYPSGFTVQPTTITNTEADFDLFDTSRYRYRGIVIQGKYFRRQT